MKIIAIRLKNLTSIEGSVEIDFTMEPLSSAGIFAISGATGAGKSTLLDALCLALYDKAPRFAASVESINLADVGDNQINQSDVRNLLTASSAGCESFGYGKRISGNEERIAGTVGRVGRFDV